MTDSSRFTNFMTLLDRWDSRSQDLFRTMLSDDPLLLTRCDAAFNTPLHHVLYTLLDLQITGEPLEESCGFVHEFLDAIPDSLVPTISVDSINSGGDSCLVLLLRSMASPNFPISACRGLGILVSAAANPILACLQVSALLKDRAQSEWRLVSEWRAHADHFASAVATLLAMRRSEDEGDLTYTYPDSYLLERGVDGRNSIEIAVDHEIYSVLGAPRFQDLVNAIWLDSQSVRKFVGSGGATRAGVGAARLRRSTMVPTVRGSFITASESQLEMVDLGSSLRHTLADIEAPPSPAAVRKLDSDRGGATGHPLPSPPASAPSPDETMLQEKATSFLGVRPSPRNKFFLEIGAFLFFVGVLCTFVLYEGGITRRTYLLTNHYEDVFVKEPFSGVTQKAYLDISTQRDLWQWTTNVLLRGVSQNSEWTAAETTCSAAVPADGPDGKSPSSDQCEFGLVAASTPWTDTEDDDHRTYFSPIASVSLRQLRVRGAACKAKQGIAVVMGPAHPAPDTCYRSYRPSLEAKEWGSDRTPALTDAQLANVARSALTRAWSAASLGPGAAPYNASAANIMDAQVLELAGRLRAATVYRVPTAPAELGFSGPLLKKYSGSGFVAVLGGLFGQPRSGVRAAGDQVA